MLKIGILGAGRSAMAHASGITKSGLGQVVKIYAPGDGAAIAPKYGARPVHTAEDIIGDNAIDAVIIASPTDTHLDYLRAIQAAGKHVLCEMPLVRTADDAARLEELIPAFGDKVAAAALLDRFDAPIVHLRKLVESGDLGTIGMVRLGRLSAFRPGDNNWYGDFNRSGGVVLSALPLLIDAVRFCFGDVGRLYTQRAADGGDLRKDYALLVARLASGALAHLEVSWTEVDGPVRHYYEIAGSHGILEFDNSAVSKLVLQGKQGDAPQPPAPAEISNPRNPEPSTPHQLLATDFLRAIGEKGKPTASLADGLTATRLALAALESASSGSTVTAGSPVPASA